MSIFKKKNTEAENPQTEKDTKHKVLDSLNEKLQGTIYDDCIIMPRGFTIDVQISRKEERENVFLLQVIYVVKHDDFDEAMIDPVDSQGKTEDDAVGMSVEIFFGGLWHPLNQSMLKKNPMHLSVNYLMQHYDFDMYAQSIVRIGGEEKKEPVVLLNYIKAELPKYIGSKKYYWVRIFLAKIKEKKICEVRVNGSVCQELSKLLKPYIDSWDDSAGFISEKQYAIFVQREEDKCPFKKQLVVDIAKKAIERMEKCTSQEEYNSLVAELEKMAGENKNVAAEVRIFVPEILARFVLGYGEGDSLFIIQGDSHIEFKKTQLRSYFYIQQVILEYLSKKPDKEDVMRIVANSAAFRELKKAHAEGHEPKDLYVPGTTFKIAAEDYKVW